MSVTLEIARTLDALGFSVIAVKHPSWDNQSKPSESSAEAEERTARSGKLPVRKWKPYILTRPEAGELEEWFDVKQKLNAAICCGTVSMIVVVDADNDEAEVWCRKNLPLTPWMVETGKGMHRYYRLPVGTELGNAKTWAGSYAPLLEDWEERAKAGDTGAKLREKIDIRGDGGYIISPFSDHATGRTYQPHNWPWSADDEVPEWSQDWFPAVEDSTGHLAGGLNGEAVQPDPLRARVVNPRTEQRKGKKAADNKQQKLISDAFGDPTLRLSNKTQEFLRHGAQHGERNNCLIAAACDMAAHMKQSDAEPDLVNAAMNLSGMEYGEVKATIDSAYSQKRDPARKVRETLSTDEQRSKIVLVPGSHDMPEGSKKKVGSHEFVSEVLARIPRDRIYITNHPCVALKGPDGRLKILEMNRSNARVMIDRYCMLVSSQFNKAEKRVQITDRACSADTASLVLENLVMFSGAAKLRHLKQLTQTPAFMRDEDGKLKPLASGWNEGIGYYRDDDTPIGEALNPGLSDDREYVEGVLWDLVEEFPFKDKAADFHAFVALLLSAIMRPAFDGPMPMFIAQATIPRSGKSKLMAKVFGYTIMGQEVDAQSVPKTDEELDKRVVAWLSTGRQALLLDNVDQKQELDSPTLASLVTSTRYTSRILGKSEEATHDNFMLVMLTGNNPRMTDELSKRMIPIRLSPKTDRPEDVKFVHGDLVAWVKECRPKVIKALHGMALGWEAAGSKPPPQAFGGFEEWMACVGGICHAWGMDSFFTTRKKWSEGASSDGDVVDFLERWWSLNRSQHVTMDTLLSMAGELVDPDDGSKQSQKNRLRRILNEWGERVTRIKDSDGETDVMVSVQFCKRVGTRGAVLKVIDGTNVESGAET